MSFLMTTTATLASLLAQATAPTTAPAAAGTAAPATPPAPGATGAPAQPSGLEALLMQPMFFLALLLIVFYIFIFRSKRKQEQQRRDVLNQVKRGDKVQTIGGIIGNVTAVEDNRIQIKVDESSNTKIWFARSAIHRVYSDEPEKAASK